MQRGWSEAEFHDSWSISPEERIFLQNKPPETRVDLQEAKALLEELG
jgi:hypothetical protein